MRIELLRLRVGVAGRAGQAERVLAAAEFQPEQKMSSIPFYCRLYQLESERELFVEIADARREPRHEPVARCQQQSLVEAIIRARFLARQQHVPAGQPDVGRVAALL